MPLLRVFPVLDFLGVFSELAVEVFDAVCGPKAFAELMVNAKAVQGKRRSSKASSRELAAEILIFCNQFFSSSIFTCASSWVIWANAASEFGMEGFVTEQVFP